MLGIFTEAPARRNAQPAAFALVRAALTVRRVNCGAWHVVSAELAATSVVATTASGRVAASNNTAVHDFSDHVIDTP
jgi:hypothetical protein